MDSEYTLRNVERFTRFVLGFSLVLSILILPLSAFMIALITFISIYPLFTALIALDPLFLLVDILTERKEKDFASLSPSFG